MGGLDGFTVRSDGGWGNTFDVWHRCGALVLEEPRTGDGVPLSEIVAAATAHRCGP